MQGLAGTKVALGIWGGQDPRGAELSDLVTKVFPASALQALTFLLVSSGQAHKRPAWVLKGQPGNF